MARDVYLALGDSITAGYGATHPSLGFVRHLSDFVKQHALAEQTLVVAKNGWTTKDVWNAVHRVAPHIWNRTNVLTLLTGGNDLRKLLRRQYLSISSSPLSPTIVSQRLDEFGFYMDRLCGFLSYQQVPHFIIATVYNPVPNFPLGVQAIEGLNRITREVAKRHNLPIVDVYEGFRNNEVYYIENYRLGRFEDLVSPIRRPIHPNNTGHKQIADLISAELKRRIRKKQAKLLS